MQPSTPGESRNSRNAQSRGEGRNGNRSRHRRRRSGGPQSSEARRDSAKSDEFRPSDQAARRSGRQAPAPAAAPLSPVQKFLKLITFGLYDPAAKPARPTAKSGNAPARKSSAPSERSAKEGSEKQKRERRKPVFVEPTTPRLYVGNLSYQVSNADLETLFAAHGSVVEASVVTQAATGRSKGFAFVEMGSVAEAKAAAAALNDHEWQGRQILVTGAKSDGRAEERTDAKPERAPRSAERAPREEGKRRGERGERGERGRSGRSRGASDEVDKSSRQVRPLVIETVSTPTLIVDNLNAEASEVDIQDLFAGIGTIVRREESGSGQDERTKTYQIELAETSEAQLAVERLHGKCFMGHQLKVTGAKAE